jgi:hypothetical protein
MLLNEARERAIKIWGVSAVVINHYGHSTRRISNPGEPEWYVEIDGDDSHSFDCNGHVTCHKACDDLEARI